ncbi:hypothetical protein HGRIS_009722 [Hohenbuehelia grisea]|uniref:Proteasome inhibitor PI31 subunit n=1 Tax=Hohenbuehelia grisea TaxID=104357 RepID=A0ABR3J217_9AGAR
MSNNLLDPSAIVSKLPSYLPSSAKTLKSPHDGIAALLHTAMAAVEFRLIDDHTPANSTLLNVLPAEWNQHGPGNYTFRYRHDQSSLEFVMKVAKLGSRTLINAIAVESDKAASLDISTNDFVSPSFYPHEIAAENAEPLVHGFISSSRITDLIGQFKLKIIQRLVPGLRKEGYTEETSEGASSGARPNQPNNPEPQPARPHPDAPPRAPEIHPYQHLPPDNPLEIGRRDLDPFPRNPFSPPPLFPRGGGDGMFVGPSHPMFGGQRGPSGIRGPWGGDGYLPPMGAPPGARFDPVGPGIGPFPGGGNPLGGRGPLRRGDPDNDEFMPPGARDMFM